MSFAEFVDAKITIGIFLLGLNLLNECLMYYGNRGLISYHHGIYEELRVLGVYCGDVSWQLFILRGIEFDYRMTLLIAFVGLLVSFLKDGLRIWHVWWQYSECMPLERTAFNVFMNPGTPLATVVPIFVAQVCLLTMFALHAYSQDVQLSSSTYRYYFIAIPITLALRFMALGSPSVGGQGFGKEFCFWCFIWSAASGGEKLTGDTHRGRIVFPTRCEVIIRLAMSFTVNFVAARLITFSVPLILMASDSNIDFVKDAAAFFVIFQMDDLSTEQTYNAEACATE